MRCNRCDGAGTIPQPNGKRRFCPICLGTGKQAKESAEADPEASAQATRKRAVRIEIAARNLLAASQKLADFWAYGLGQSHPRPDLEDERKAENLGAQLRRAVDAAKAVLPDLPVAELSDPDVQIREDAPAESKYAPFPLDAIKWDQSMDPILPPGPLEILEQVMRDALPKHGQDSWRAQPIEAHVQHAFEHSQDWFHITNDLDCFGARKDEDHLAHACCRLWLALALREEQARQAGRGGEAAKG